VDSKVIAGISWSSQSFFVGYFEDALEKKGYKGVKVYGGPGGDLEPVLDRIRKEYDHIHMGSLAVGGLYIDSPASADIFCLYKFEKPD
jgi:hypothetical protein